MRKVLLSSVASLLLILALPIVASRAVAAPAPQAKAPAASPVNLNTASEADLEALPGIGPATAKKIIAGRPYTSVADLSKAGVRKSTIDKIAPMVTVGGRSTASPSTPAPSPAQKPATQPPAQKPAAAPSQPTATSGAKTSGAATPQQPPEKGMVWVNLSTKVFHREGDRYYGNTKNGKFMTEADAIKAGYREAKTEKKPGK